MSVAVRTARSRRFMSPVINFPRWRRDERLRSLLKVTAVLMAKHPNVRVSVTRYTRRVYYDGPV